MKRILKIVSLICLFFAYSLNVYSQSSNIQIPSQDDINKLNKKIYKLLAKSDCYKDYRELKIVHIYDMIYQGTFEKIDFENYNFLTKIKPKYLRKKALFSKYGYLSTRAFIYETEDDLVALSSNLMIYCLVDCPKAYLEERQMIYYILDWETEFVFSIERTPKNMFFVLEKSGNISVLVKAENHISLMNMNDFINKYWYNFVNGINASY